jgi:hypothetical protein
MKRISSKGTLFYKRLFPLLWFGILTFIVVSMLLESGRTHGANLPAVIVPIVMAAFGYIILRQLVFNLVDEVWDDGDALLVRNAGVEERIPFTNIINLGFSSLIRPQRVTLTLRQPGLFGKDITFSGPTRFLTLARSPIIDELIERIDRARRA